MLWVLRFATGIAIAALAVVLVVRLLPMDPVAWDVDPLEERASGLRNGWRVAPPGIAAVSPDGAAPVFATSAASLASAFDTMALNQPRTRRIAGSPDALQATYLQRSRVLGFPDLVSVRFLDLGGGKSSLAVFSRARFGDYDWGVNRARVENWLAALEPFAQ